MELLSLAVRWWGLVSEMLGYTTSKNDSGA